MSSVPFGPDYSARYDALYGDKDYDVETDLLEVLFQRHGSGPIRTILDLGCGTGSHALALARRDYQVTALDRSPSMIEQAKQKFEALPADEKMLQPDFLLGDLRTADLGQQFDAVVMMFAVLGYQLTNSDVVSTLNTVRRHLSPGGLFIGDFWYGPALLTIRPSDRIKVIPTPTGEIIRAASGQLDVRHHLARIDYQLWHLSDDRVVSQTQETHQVRYFFPQELEFHLQLAGLELCNLSCFPALDQPADDTVWSACLVAKAV